MARCQVCGTESDKPIEVTHLGDSHTFDTLECAVHVLAPACPHCGVRVLGHGLEVDGRVYCCAHCADSADDGGGAARPAAAGKARKSSSSSDRAPSDGAMTQAQASYLRDLSERAGEEFDESLSKADASKRIEELQERTGRGKR
jgi:uncharacterized Zn finger protein (UPF0148 family)